MFVFPVLTHLRSRRTLFGRVLGIVMNAEVKRGAFPTSIFSFVVGAQQFFIWIARLTRSFGSLMLTIIIRVADLATSF
jgi:hypothetical protein